MVNRNISLKDTDCTVPVSTTSFLLRLTALARRDRQTRFSGGALGYLWAYATPIAWIAFVVLLFKILGRSAPISTSSELFVATGILPFIIFRQTITAAMRTLIANRYMLYIQPVSRGEILMATSLLEFVNMIMTSIIIFGGLIIFFDTDEPNHILTAYLAMMSAWILGTGFGGFLASIGQWSDSFARAVPIALRPMMWISGVFYTATELPKSGQNLLWWNPLFHSIEILREGFFLGYKSPVGELWYPVLMGILFYMASFFVSTFVDRTRRARHKL